MKPGQQEEGVAIDARLKCQPHLLISVKVLFNLEEQEEASQNNGYLQPDDQSHTLILLKTDMCHVQRHRGKQQNNGVLKRIPCQGMACVVTPSGVVVNGHIDWNIGHNTSWVISLLPAPPIQGTEIIRA